MIKRSILNFPWTQHFRFNPDPNWQVNFFTETIMNIINNFIPNKTIQVVPRDPPWIDKSLKIMLNKQNRIYKNYKKHGFKSFTKSLLTNLVKTVNQGFKLQKVITLTN